MSDRPRHAPWGTALAIVGVPTLFFVVPMILTREAAGLGTAEEVARWSRQRGSAVYLPLLVQLLAGLLLVPATWGVRAVCTRARRGERVARAGQVVGSVGAVAVVLLLGMELGQMRALLTMADEESAVALAVSGHTWWVYSVALLTSLAVVFVLPLVLGVALVRARVAPRPVLALVLLPVLVGLLPLPARTGEVSGILTLVAPAAVLALYLLRPSGEHSRGRADAPRLVVDQV